MRTYIIAGNWKMHAGPEAAKTLTGELLADDRLYSALGTRHSVVVCPPFVSLAAVRAQLADAGVGLGAQNCHAEHHGAYTGEVSAPMLVEAGCSWVILGHSERRRDFAETNESIGHKAVAALQAGLRPIVCVGESHQERLDGVTTTVITRQLQGIADVVGADRLGGLVIAYEPIWAIGTGLAATPEQAQDVHATIREALAWYTPRTIPLLYGGSVTDVNASQLFACADIDGALVGGASLKAASFAGIVHAAVEAGQG